MSQGVLMRLRVKEERKSESRLVMRRIEIALNGKIISRANGLTSLWSFRTRELDEPSEEAKQMTADTHLAGAASHTPPEWHDLNWRAAHRNVRRLQARIVKATREGKHGKVKALQWLLTHSLSGKALAVKRVTENQGQRTPGIDGERWNTPAAKTAALRQLQRRGYKAQPLRRVYLPKSNGKLRPLGIPTMKDRAMQALYLLALDPVAETTGDPNSYGFRVGRCAADALEQSFQLLRRPSSAAWIWEGDIRACFEQISHDWLLTHIPMDKTILRQWLKVGFLEQQEWFPTEAGTPQGGIISPTLMNLTLDGLEAQMKALAPRRRRADDIKLALVRYADDLIIPCSSQEFLVETVMPVVTDFLRERGLELSTEKTKLTHIEDGFDFLGQNLRKYHSKLLTKLSAKSVKALLDKVRALIKANPQSKPEDLIRQLNPILRGWANYHRHAVSKRIFSQVDHAMYQALWHWARRRHPHKGVEWVRRKYFRQPDRFGFFANVTGKDGQPIRLQLFQAQSVAIRRHIKIRSAANPYDPSQADYFEQRLAEKWLQEEHRTKLRRLWVQQGGHCLVCDQSITRESGWHLHHLIPRAKGGDDKPSNLVLLHPNCHRLVHSRNLKVVKPGLGRGSGKA